VLLIHEFVNKITTLFLSCDADDKIKPKIVLPELNIIDALGYQEPHRVKVSDHSQVLSSICSNYYKFAKSKKERKRRVITSETGLELDLKCYDA
jgi:hypothetical protein